MQWNPGRIEHPTCPGFRCAASGLPSLIIDRTVRALKYNIRRCCHEFPGATIGITQLQQTTESQVYKPELALEV